MLTYVQYFLDSFIVEFFKRTSVTHETCNEKAASLIKDSIKSVSIQESCSYTVYDDIRFKFIVQFRIQSLSLETTTLASKIHDDLASITTYHEQLEDTSQETVSVYSLERISGISYLEYHFMNNHVEDFEDNLVLQADLMMNLARYVVYCLTSEHCWQCRDRFFVASWKTSQSIDSTFFEKLRQKYIKDLQLLLYHLSSRFYLIIQRFLNSMSLIFFLLSFVLLHVNFSSCNIIVHSISDQLINIMSESCLDDIIDEDQNW